MRALGAEVTRTPDAEGMQGAISRARELAARDPNAFMAGQFENPANPDYHYETTAGEIFEQMDGQLDAVVIGSGTAGTFTGVARYMKEHLPRVLAIAVEPQGSILGGGTAGRAQRSKESAPASCPRILIRRSATKFHGHAIGRRFGMVKQLARARACWPAPAAAPMCSRL